MNPDLTTIGGIVALTLVLVEILKRLIGSVQRKSSAKIWELAGEVPTWLWAVVVASALTAGAVMIFHSIDGGLWSLIAKAVGAAATAGGLYEWLRNPAKPIGESKAAVEAFTGTKIDPGDGDSYSMNAWGWLVVGCGLLVACGGVGGCASSGFVEGIDAQWKPIRSDYVAYVEADSKLTETDKKIRQDSAGMVDKLIAAEKERIASQPPSRP